MLLEIQDPPPAHISVIPLILNINPNFFPLVAGRCLVKGIWCSEPRRKLEFSLCSHILAQVCASHNIYYKQFFFLSMKLIPTHTFSQ